MFSQDSSSSTAVDDSQSTLGASQDQNAAPIDMDVDPDMTEEDEDDNPRLPYVPRAPHSNTSLHSLLLPFRREKVIEELEELAERLLVDLRHVLERSSWKACSDASKPLQIKLLRRDGS